MRLTDTASSDIVSPEAGPAGVVPPGFDLQGHRGARGLFPENTIEGFRAALALGLRGFELDVGVTRDGAVVLYHDPRLNPDITRGPDGAWLDAPGPLLRDLTRADLLAFDVGRIRPGSAYAALYPDQRPHDGARIPCLADLLALPGAPRLLIELKLFPDHPDWTVSPEEMVERVLREVDAADALDRVAVQSFDWRAPRHARRIRPRVATGWLTRAETVAAPALWWGVDARPGDFDAVPDRVAAEGGGVWTPSHAELTPSCLARAHALGLRVVPWTVNEPARMAALAAWGVDGIITDRPDLFPRS